MTEEKFDFNNLIIFEMANNHQGSVAHGKKIIDEMASLTREYNLRGAIKLQFRDHKTFIHPDSLKGKKSKHVERFLSTELSEKDFYDLIQYARKKGLIIVVSPWDEISVDLAIKLNADAIKVASLSAKDWPLLEKIVQTRKPVIVATGGLSIHDVDNLASFMDHHYINVAFMHCVALYPTANSDMQLNKIQMFKKRYPNITIGFSTHEPRDNYEAIQVAYALGARLFEKHVGVETNTIQLNSYSTNPEETRKWIEAYKRAVDMLGAITHVHNEEEQKHLDLIRRGVFVKKNIKKGQVIKKSDIFHAFPLKKGQMTSGDFSEGLLADKDYKKNEALSQNLVPKNLSSRQIIYRTIHQVKGMLNEAGIQVGLDNDVEISHHYGLGKFFETGAVMVHCINREYCKIILVMLQGQKYPLHHHKKKEETLQVLSGEIILEVEGKSRLMLPGDTIVIRRGVRHSFYTNTGVIFEEISTTYFNGDSIYKDQALNEMDRSARKTKLVNWGFHHFD